MHIPVENITEIGRVKDIMNYTVPQTGSIKNLSQPAIIRSYPMTNPYGPGKDGDLLFVCDGTAGLKVYDASDPKFISSNLVFSYPGIKAYDVIPLGDVLVMVGDDGLYQYDYSNIENVSLLSRIEVKKE